MQHRFGNGRFPFSNGAFALCLIVIAALSLATPCKAQNPEVAFAALVDPDRSKTIGTVQSYMFRPITSTFGGGFTTGAYWVRITFAGEDPVPQNLRFRPLSTDSIELFTPMPDGTWQLSRNGEAVARSGTASQAIGWYGFDVDPAPGLVTYYARITTASVAAITVASLPLDDVARAAIRGAAVYAGLLALQFLAIFLAVTRLDPLHSMAAFSFVAMSVLVSAFVYWSSGYGLLAVNLQDGRWADMLFNLFGGVALSSIIAFHYFFLRDYDPPRVFLRLCLGVLAISVCGSVLTLTVPGILGLRVTFVAYFAIAPMLLGLVLTLRRDGAIARHKLRYVYAPYLAAYGTNVVTRMGWIDNAFLYGHSIEALTFINATLILALLWLKNNAADDAMLEREVALARISAELAVARDYRETQLDLVQTIDRLAQGVADQTRQVLARGGFGHEAARVERSVEALKAVIGRCLFAYRAEAGHWNVTPDAFDPGQALREMAETLAPAGTWRFETAPVTIRSDRLLFDLAARNVLSNALAYRMAGTVVAVTAGPALQGDRAGALVTVRNETLHGAPFNPDRVFEKFYRGASAQTQSGTGLGLFITREAITALSGDIALTGADHQAGAGAAVTAKLWIPTR